MKNLRLYVCAMLGALCVAAGVAQGPSLEELFLNPRQAHRPLIIWQWMDGLVTKDGITRDLEAFKEAGLAGVQNFQIGGPMQMRIGDPEVKIGSDRWKDMLRWTLDECERLGLTFGTHNCPGWSSSAYPTVKPEYSMLQLVYSETPVGRNSCQLLLAKPDVDPRWNYYEDVAVMLVPADSVAAFDEIVDVSPYFDASSGMLRLPGDMALKDGMRAMRIGQTTIGKTNVAQAPESGRGLECDKLSRKAVLEFWNGYPKMLIETAGHHVGKTFNYLEIDSYEAGGQVWSAVLPDEFRKRMGYDITPYLPYMTGRLKIIGDSEATGRFRKDWQEVVKQCVAENYYGYMTELCEKAGLKMMIEPYGTGGRKPFDILDFYKIVEASKGADIATEFWQAPDWGWRDMARHEAAMRKLQRPLLIAEAFTCWPLRAWQDSPETLKPMCDRAFCTGVNRMMLHAGAANPWPNVQPGMSFGLWGTHFVPGQTWWKAGGARELFGYMARCQALLQQGVPAAKQLPGMAVFKTYHRVSGDTDIIFICNPTPDEATDTLVFDPSGRSVEIWNPYSKAMNAMEGCGRYGLTIEPYGSRFLIFRPGNTTKAAESRFRVERTVPVDDAWTLDFPETDTVRLDSLMSWTELEESGMKYFSGTATYRTCVNIDGKLLKDKAGRVMLSLGKVKDMARVRVNGHDVALMWKSPFICNISEYVRKGRNEIEIDVTNLWPNRMIGDEHEPDDLEWSDPEVYGFAPGAPEIGRFLLNNPEWLRLGLPRPSKGRKTVGCFKYFRADSPLLPSGIFGPVELMFEKQLIQ